MWTQFYDMSSGGSQKLKWDKIYIELPEDSAVEAFERLFDRNPWGITCSCCGSDYSINEYGTLEEATEYHRTNYSTKAASPLADFVAQDNIRVIDKAELLESYKEFLNG